MTIHIELDGQQLFPNVIEKIQVIPYRLRTDEPGNLTIGTGAVTVVNMVPPGVHGWLVNLRNVSEGGQTIGIDCDIATLTLANAGILLFPGESIQLANLFIQLFGIASAAGGELRRWAVRTDT